MPRAKFQTLTEQMFYTLLCLKEECCGIDILDRVPAMTGQRVRIGSGTLYTLLEQFAEAGMIRETRAEGRKHSYILTERGKEMLAAEYRRICAQVQDYRQLFGDEPSAVGSTVGAGPSAVGHAVGDSPSALENTAGQGRRKRHEKKTIPSEPVHLF